ncbi:MAG: hypothetical protein EOP86_25255, partial [Verrucomicrobiaceae bacterium]
MLIVAALFAGLVRNARSQGAAMEPRLRRFAAGLGLWLAAVAVAAGSGWMADSPMPRLMIVLPATVLVSLAAGCSWAGEWFTGLPLPLLVGFQAFRLPLELILHDWAATG